MGDTGVGKTSLSVKYCEGVFGHDYVPTLGVLPHGGKTIAQKAGDIKYTHDTLVKQSSRLSVYTFTHSIIMFVPMFVG
jgi:GTPase SAR1 family protein